MNAFEEKVYTLFCELNKVDFKKKEIEISTNEGYKDEAITILYQTGDKYFIRTYEEAAAKLNSLKGTNAITIHAMLDALNDPELIIDLPNENCYLNPDKISRFKKGNSQIRLLNDAHKSDFDLFYSECSNEDKEQGQVDIEDDLVHGFYINNKLVGVGSFWFEGAVLADIGMLIHPEYQRKGIGKQLLEQMCINAHAEGKINQWRYDNKNEGSRRLSQALGFTPLISLQVIQRRTKS